MRSLEVTTWNVLHRVHAVNWSEAPATAFPDEHARIRAIAAAVTRWLATPRAVVCLQEVSGDQLRSLREAAQGHDIHVHRYSRVPKVRGSTSAELEDPSEQLVTITSASSTFRAGRTFDSDPGKGLLAVEVDGVVVVNTHVSFGDRRGAQLALVGAVAREGPARAVVAGDFNAHPDLVHASLGEDFVLAALGGERPTRIATRDHPAKTIDHVAVLGGEVVSAAVADAAGLSDHNPVIAGARF